MGRHREHLTCTAIGCDREHYAKGLCKTHYRREARREARASTCRHSYFDTDKDRWVLCGEPRLPGCAIPICINCLERIEAIAKAARDSIAFTGGIEPTRRT